MGGGGGVFICCLSAGGGDAYSFIACLIHLTVVHTSRTRATVVVVHTINFLRRVTFKVCTSPAKTDPEQKLKAQADQQFHDLP